MSPCWLEWKLLWWVSIRVRERFREKHVRACWAFPPEVARSLVPLNDPRCTHKETKSFPAGLQIRGLNLHR